MQKSDENLKLNCLTEESIEILLDYYQEDYELLPSVSRESILEQYRHDKADTVWKNWNIYLSGLEKDDNPIKVSVVIPVYNTGNHLIECLVSVLSQSLQDIQIIIVNDASTDHSSEIIHYYAAQDNRIEIVCHEKNRGLPAARNSGMRLVKGDYVVHLDSDDFWLDPLMLEKLYALSVIRNSDTIKFNGYQYAHGKIVNKLTRAKENFNNIKFSENNCLWNYPSVWRYFIKTDFLTRNNIVFNESISIGEDQIFTSELLVKAERISVIDDKFYGYRISNHSLMRGKWEYRQFDEEVRHSIIVAEIIKDNALALQKYTATKLTYWIKNVIPRAFEDISREERSQFFSQMRAFTDYIDCEHAVKQKSWGREAKILLDLLSRNDIDAINDRFISDIHSGLSIFTTAAINKWPDASIKPELPPGTTRIKGTIYIHAGTHKTGTSHLQQLLAKNQKQLNEDDIFYSECASAWEINCHLLPISLIEKKSGFLGFPVMDPETIWQNIYLEYEKSGCTDLLLSSEFFSPEFTRDELPNLNKLKLLLGDNDVKFIFYLRPQAERLESGYSQLVKSEVRALQCDFEEYLEKAKPALDYSWLLQAYANIFGQDTIIVRPYDREKFISGDISADFLHVLKREHQKYTKILKPVNERRPTQVINFLRRSYRLQNGILTTRQLGKYQNYINQWYTEKTRNLPQINQTFLSDKEREKIRSFYESTNREVEGTFYNGSGELFTQSTGSKLSHESVFLSQFIDPPLNWSEKTLHQLFLDCWVEKSNLENQIGELHRERKTLLNGKTRLQKQYANLQKQYVNLKARHFINRIKKLFSIKKIGERYLGKSLTYKNWKFYRVLRKKQLFKNIENENAFNFSLTYRKRQSGVTALLRVKNEQTRIRSCLESIYDTFDEIVLVDNNSSDKTLQLVNEFVAQFDRTNNKIKVYDYPFSVSKCGPEHQQTDPSSVHSLAYYYNWGLSKCSYSMVCKFDADMQLSSSPERVQVFQEFLFQLSLKREPQLGSFFVQTIYINADGQLLKSKEELNNEIRVFPNLPSIHFRKAKDWEVLESPYKLDEVTCDGLSVYEIKDVGEDEFSHWSTNEFHTPRKVIEYENFTLVKNKMDKLFAQRFDPVTKI